MKKARKKSKKEKKKKKRLTRYPIGIPAVQYEGWW
jgi:hypothetical protein